MGEKIKEGILVTVKRQGIVCNLQSSFAHRYDLLYAQC